MKFFRGNHLIIFISRLWPSVHFHNYLRSLNSRRITSVKLWKKRNTFFFFLNADFGITDAKYNGKENENQEKYCKVLQGKPIFNKLPLQELWWASLLWRRYPRHREDAPRQHDTSIQVSPGRLHLGFSVTGEVGYIVNVLPNQDKWDSLFFRTSPPLAPTLYPYFKCHLFSNIALGQGGRCVRPKVILIQGTLVWCIVICVLTILDNLNFIRIIDRLGRRHQRQHDPWEECAKGGICWWSAGAEGEKE